MDRFREADAEFSYDRIEEEIEKLAGQITGEWQLLDASDGWGTDYELHIDGAVYIAAHCDDCGGELAEVETVDCDDGRDCSTYRCVRCRSADVTAIRGPRASLVEAIARTIFAEAPRQSFADVAAKHMGHAERLSAGEE